MASFQSVARFVVVEAEAKSHPPQTVCMPGFFKRQRCMPGHGRVLCPVPALARTLEPTWIPFATH